MAHQKRATQPDKRWGLERRCSLPYRKSRRCSGPGKVLRWRIGSMGVFENLTNEKRPSLAAVRTAFVGGSQQSVGEHSREVLGNSDGISRKTD